MIRSTALFALLLLASLSFADEEGGALRERVLDAYRDTNTYLATITYQMREKRGRWTNTQATDFRIAFDRAGGRLLIDKPDIYVIIDGDKLRMRSARYGGRHLEIDAPQPLTYRNLLTALPMLAQPELPDLMLLLGEDPASEQPDAKIEQAGPAEEDPQKRTRLRIQGSRFMVILHIEKESSLVTLAHVQWNPQVLGRPKTDLIQFRHQAKIENHNDELPADTFRFDIVGSKAVTTLEQLFGRHALLGKPAPAIALTDLQGLPFQLANIQSRMILIGFWATWFPGHQIELEALEAIRTWAAQSGHPLEVISVNLADDRGKAAGEAQKLKLAVPVLLATDAAAADAYDAHELPRSVLLMDGQVAAVFETIGPQMQKLQQFITRAAAKPASRPAGE